MIYGYARISTKDQSLDLQREQLLKAGCDMVREESASGGSLKGRPELAILLQFLRAGDTLMVTRIDRLARDMRDLQNIAHDLGQRGVTIRATEQPIDTSTPAGKLFLDMLGMFAEFERNLIAERRMEGIKRAKAAGKHMGRPKSFDAGRIRELHAAGNGPASIARQLGCDRATVYRALAVHAQGPANLNGHE